MSQETAVKPICSKCGSEALGPALFCYACGARLSVEDASDIAENAAELGPDKPIAPPQGDPFEPVEESPEKEAMKPPTDDAAAEGDAQDGLADIGMQTASALRKDPEVMRLRRIEVRWSSDEGTPNIWFLVSTVALTLVALAIFLISLYLR
jgi:hypothetical protein